VRAVIHPSAEQRILQLLPVRIEPIRYERSTDRAQRRSLSIAPATGDRDRARCHRAAPAQIQLRNSLRRLYPSILQAVADSEFCMRRQNQFIFRRASKL
jgi:hypothetical protein